MQILQSIGWSCGLRLPKGNARYSSYPEDAALTQSFIYVLQACLKCGHHLIILHCKILSNYFRLTHLPSQVHLCNRSFSTPSIVNRLPVNTKGYWAWPSSHVPSLSQLLDHIDCSREHDVERVACIALGDDLLSCCELLPSNSRIVLSSPEDSAFVE